MKISIIVTSYNHEKYIAQCIEGILCQKGDFEMEVILGDDCSTDQTGKIIKEYKSRYPDLFVEPTNTQNLGITKNLKRCLDTCSGNYIAICEGDDYWTNPSKLQKQMEILERNPDYSMCFSALTLYYEEENKLIAFSDQQELNKYELTIYDLLERNYIGNFSCCMYRRSTIQRLPQGIFEFYTVDWMFNMACSEIGKIGFIKEPMSVYRKHSQGAWTGKSELQQLKEVLNLIDIYNKFFIYKYDKQFMIYRCKVESIIEVVGKQHKLSTDVQIMSQSDLKTENFLINKNIENPGSSSNIPSEYNAFELPIQGLTGPKKAFITTFKNIFRPYWRFLIKIRNYVFYDSRYLLWKLRAKTPVAVKTIVKTILFIPQRIVELRKLTNDTIDLIILDTIFPHPFSPFRYEEFRNYLDHFPNTVVTTTCEQFRVLSEKRSPNSVICEFEKRYPSFRGKVFYTRMRPKYFRAKLAYTTFLNNMSQFLEALEERRVPFVFTLYPGGAFELDQPNSDVMLTRILQSPQFRKVIVTQKLTYDYLVSKKLCSPDQIEFIYGVVSSLPPSKNITKKFFGFEKETLDICFVAYKYMEKGIDKGYDVFISAAKKLVQLHDNIQFHVVGNFNEKDIPIDGLNEKITFYGVQKNEWFADFYRDKDIILSPNIPFTLLRGSFDGFPTASCTDAGLQEVAMFCTDELDLNIKFTDRKDMVIIPHDPNKIATLVDYYHSHPEMLREIAKCGAAKIRDIYSYESQMVPRIKILEAELEKERTRARTS